MQEQLPRDVFEETTRMYSWRVLGGTPSIRRIPGGFFKSSAIRSPRHGYLPSETRHKPVLGALNANVLFAKVSEGRYPYPGLSMWILLQIIQLTLCIQIEGGVLDGNCSESFRECFEQTACALMTL